MSLLDNKSFVRSFVISAGITMLQEWAAHSAGRRRGIWESAFMVVLLGLLFATVLICGSALTYADDKDGGNNLECASQFTDRHIDATYCDILWPNKEK